MGYHVDGIMIINTFGKHLLILLDVLLMEYILREIGMEIIKPEYVYVIYLPLPDDADKVVRWRAGTGYLETPNPSKSLPIIYTPHRDTH